MLNFQSLTPFQDKYENITGTDLNGKIEVSILKAPQTDEVPMLQGNVQKTEIPLVNGCATVQSLSIEQNTAGKDGQEYVLSFVVIVNGQRQQNIRAFTLPFLFFNGKIRIVFVAFLTCNDPVCMEQMLCSRTSRAIHEKQS